MSAIWSMEPLIPSLDELRPAAERVLHSGGELGRHLHPLTLAAIAELVRAVNCYYSNLIEGHDTHPASIDRALRKDYSKEPKKRDLQLEALAHIEVQRLIDARFEADPGLAITTPEFLSWIHREFYERLPEEFRVVTDPTTGKSEPVHPGKWRHHDVIVGEHTPPPSAEIPAALARFHEVYDLDRHSAVDALALLGAAHHRLLWIHPFGDGNGRVTRLMSDAWLRRAGVRSHGLWTASRGLARARTDYKALLAGADNPRWNDYDGRGARTLKGLTDFAAFFLRICEDQIAYMGGILEVDRLAERVARYVSGRAAGFFAPPEGNPKAPDRLREELAPLVSDLIYAGSIERKDLPRRLGTLPRTARRIIEGGSAEGLLVSASSRAPIHLHLPAGIGATVFPELFGTGAAEPTP